MSNIKVFTPSFNKFKYERALAKQKFKRSKFKKQLKKLTRI